MTKNIIIALVCVVGLQVMAAEKKVIEIGERPESVVRGFGGLLYVTVMGGKETGDAVVKVIDGDEIRVFATGLDEPKGIAFAGGHLVTTDVKKVWQIDAKGNKSVLAEEKDFPHPVSYLNDTAAAADGKSVYVTDMGANTKMFGPNGLWPLDSAEAKAIPMIARVYKIGMDGKVTVAVDSAPEMLNPNGVSAPSRNTLLVAEFFHGNILSVKKGKVTVLNSGFRGADAIEQGRGGVLYVSSWSQGKVWKLDKKGQNAEVLLEGLKSAADFFLDRKGNQLVIPDMLAGTLTYLPLEK